MNETPSTGGLRPVHSPFEDALIDIEVSESILTIGENPDLGSLPDTAVTVDPDGGWASTPDDLIGDSDGDGGLVFTPEDDIDDDNASLLVDNPPASSGDAGLGIASVSSTDALLSGDGGRPSHHPTSTLRGYFVNRKVGCQLQYVGCEQ